MSEEEVCCDICGEPHNEKYVQTLRCNHSFHYECIQKSFKYNQKHVNNCPLCNVSHGLLPMVNGLPKLIKGIHFINQYPTDYQSKPCNELLKSGKRKGEECGAKCMLGFTICKRHHISTLKQKNKNILIQDPPVNA
jgi:hypothetical protein